MLIQSTKVLLQELLVRAEQPINPEPFFSWHAHLITVNRRKAILLVNNLTRYVVLLYGLKKKDFQHLNELIIQGLQDAFFEGGISQEVIDLYLKQSGSITYAKTSSKSVLGHLYSFANEIKYYITRQEGKVFLPAKSSHWASNIFVGDGGNDYFIPYNILLLELNMLTGKKVISIPAVQIKASLKLEKATVWRRIIVPTKFTFSEFHTVLQAAFGWGNYHLHEFYVYDDSSPGYPIDYINHPGYHEEGYCPILEIITENDEIEPDLPLKFDSEVKLADFIPSHKYFKYIYDYGDNWQHYIEVEQLIPDYSFTYSQCLAGEGNTPPEDVGGDTGYSDFLEIIADPNHPEYEKYKLWATYQGYKDFNIDEINIMLKNVSLSCY